MNQKKYFLLYSLLVCTIKTCPIGDNCNPGCIRQNSAELRKALIMMALEQSNFLLLPSLIDEENVNQIKVGGKSILEHVKSVISKTYNPGLNLDLVSFLEKKGGI
jgi:hypothetical protein